ncbi:DNA cytosine methyltransferase [Pseudoclavibacter sp. AY1H1]|uniref:DNA cytosine methyltransferase n=1 Tax=Pseudoclavibacter sp. AY1H1 TaxID=2080584 RepID=UPI000CE8C023|nr:DNA cytosine methyltransferase [Pseudoclavibacter sp. AY1H1]PPF38515.1 DNA cytosine methyltransferase [Pseudoclavibacter sp. AY1H1]
MKAVSLFSNCGAGDVGYRNAGFDFRVMAELDPNRLAVALANHPLAVGVPGDLRSTWSKVVEQWHLAEPDRRPDLLAACPPCQGMSTARSGLGSHDDHEAGGRDSRNLLVTVIEAVARQLKPRAIVVENVPAFLTRSVPHPETGGPVSAALLLVELLRADYKVFAISADLADWGVPQTRKRSFLTLIRNDEKGLETSSGFAPFPRPSHASDWGGKHVSIKESLTELAAGSLDASTAARAADPTKPMHFVPVWGERQYKMVQAIPANSGKGAWSNDGCSVCAVKSVDPDEAVCRSCGEPLLRPVVKGDKSWRLVKGFRTTSYTRMKSDSPASTITTASGRVGSDITIHPWENRLLSPLECAHLQTLPTDFEWGDALKKHGHSNLREMIGEAVPPRFTELHGRAILNFLSGTNESSLLPCEDSRALKAREALRRANAKVGTKSVQE